MTKVNGEEYGNKYYRLDEHTNESDAKQLLMEDAIRSVSGILNLIKSGKTHIWTGKIFPKDSKIEGGTYVEAVNSWEFDQD